MVRNVKTYIEAMINNGKVTDAEKGALETVLNFVDTCIAGQAKSTAAGRINGMEDGADVRSAVLLEAESIVTGDRQNAYGAPEDNFKRIADTWSQYIFEKYDELIEFSAEDVAWMMALLKMARAMAGAFHADNYIDAAGYIACAASCAKRDPFKR